MENLSVTTSRHKDDGVEKEIFSSAEVRRGTNVFLLIVFGLFTIDTFPGQFIGNPLVSNLQSSIDKINDVTGLWQGTWGLFAPNPTHTDWFLTARLTYRLPIATNNNDTKNKNNNENTTTVLYHVKWASPHWNTTTTWEKKRLFRMQEFVEDIVKDDNSLLFPVFAQHLAESHPLRIVDDEDDDDESAAGEEAQFHDDNTDHQTFYPIQVSLIRHWIEFPAPEPTTVWPEEGYHWLLGYKLLSTRKPEGEFLYYTWDRPENWEAPAAKVKTYDFLPATTTVSTSKLDELAAELFLDSLEEGSNATCVDEGTNATCWEEGDGESGVKDDN